MSEGKMQNAMKQNLFHRLWLILRQGNTLEMHFTLQASSSAVLHTDLHFDFHNKHTSKWWVRTPIPTGVLDGA